jgi:DnaD/phage-associated family protein
MARGRMINQTIAKDKRLNSLSLEAELVYLVTIPHLDRDGLILGESAVLWGTVCPRRSELLGRMDAIIGEWIAGGLAVAYECDDGRVLWFTGFRKNQGGMHYDREAPSGFPPPPGYGRTKAGLVSLPDTPMSPPAEHESGGSPEEVRSDAGASPPEVKLEEEQQHPPTPQPGDEAAAVGEVFGAWESNMPGTLTPIISDQIKDWVATFGAKETLDAIGVAVKNNARRANYVDGVLRRRAAGTDPPKTQQWGNPAPTTPNAWAVLAENSRLDQ